MDKVWIIPICVVIVGYFGIFWTLSLSEISIDISMDNNTKEAILSISNMSENNFNNYIYVFNQTDCTLDDTNGLIFCKK